MEDKRLIFWCLASQGPGISGGDRIFIEFARRWSQKYPLVIYSWKEGIAMMARNRLLPDSHLTFVRFPVPAFLNYIFRILIGIYRALTIKIDHPDKTFLYTASEFWMDSFPCFLLKLRYPGLSWIATWYQTAPSPFRGFTSGTRSQTYKINALLLWLVQLPVRPLIADFADIVLVNNELEKSVFPRLNSLGKAIVVLGAVDVLATNNWLADHKKMSKIYSAVFQGRFHPQKGVVELIDIWKQVVAKIPDAKLALIGDGPLMPAVKEKVTGLNLQNNIIFFGFVFDGPQKYQIFSQSQLVVHPAFFDSGGMAAAEAMAFGLPCIGFDLPAYASYYPQGFIKVSIGDFSAFADVIVDLLRNTPRRHSLGIQAGKYIHSSSSWESRAGQVLSSITKSD